MAPLRSGSMVLLGGGETLAVAGMDQPVVTLLSSSSLEIIATLPTSSPVSRLWPEASEEALWITERETGLISLLPLDGGPALVMEGCEGPAGVLGVGNRVWVACEGGDQVLELEASTGERLVTWEGMEGVTDLGLDSSRELLVATGRFTGMVSLIEWRSGRVRASLHLGESPPSSSPSGVPWGLGPPSLLPDGTAALIPHVLLARGGPLTFDGSVFPALSRVDLVSGEEDAEGRWMLFDRLSAWDELGDPLVLANPTDLEISTDGKRGWLLLGGSDDLAMLDLEHGRTLSLLRHLPSPHPLAGRASPEGDSLWIHFGSSQKMVTLMVGSDTLPSLVEGPLPSLAKDSWSEEHRAGKIWFHSANSDSFAWPLTRRNWMSCSSCHGEGFEGGNNVALMEAMQGSDGSPTGHTNPGSFLGAADPTTDLIRLVQDTQGGWGGVDPEAPPAEVLEMATALATYLGDSHQLPAIPSWISYRSASPFDASTYPAAAECGSCHAAQMESWEGSAHSLAGRDPFYLMAEALIREEMDPGAARWCVGCHGPLQALQGETTAAVAVGEGTESEGVGCSVCHGAVTRRRGGGNADLVLDFLPLWGGEQGHSSSPLPPFLEESAFCGSCHQGFVPVTGVPRDTTFSEWQASPQAAAGMSCQNCHMAEGQGHSFPGGNPTLGRWVGKQRPWEGGMDLLRNCVTVSLSAPSTTVAGDAVRFTVEVTNVGAAHAIPGGVPDLREVWVEIVVTGGDGETWMHSGGLSEDEVLDPDAFLFAAPLRDQDGNAILDHGVWREGSEGEDTRLMPFEPQMREFGFTVPANAHGPVGILATVWYRSFREDYYRLVVGEDAPPQVKVSLAEVIQGITLLP